MRCSRLSSIVACLVALFLVQTQSPAQSGPPVPNRVHVQTRLTDTQGVAVQQAGLSVTARLYPVPVGGAAVFAETAVVDVVDGLLAFDIGGSPSTGALDADLLAAYPALYLGLTIGNDQELSPRLALSTSPYALRSEVARAAESVTGAVDATQVAVNGVGVIDSASK
jgi:hypothetical protein